MSLEIIFSLLLWLFFHLLRFKEFTFEIFPLKLYFSCCFFHNGMVISGSYVKHNQTHTSPMI